MVSDPRLGRASPAVPRTALQEQDAAGGREAGPTQGRPVHHPELGCAQRDALLQGHHLAKPGPVIPAGGCTLLAKDILSFLVTLLAFETRGVHQEGAVCTQDLANRQGHSLSESKETEPGAGPPAPRVSSLGTAPILSSRSFSGSQLLDSRLPLISCPLVPLGGKREGTA